MSGTLIFGGIAALWVAGAVAVIAIWGDPGEKFPPWDTGSRFDLTPPTGVVASIWPLVLVLYAFWIPFLLVGNAGMAANRRLAARREARRLPRAKVSK